ncbi:MAG: transcriptional regulator [Altererythrobacter sp.]|nr:transcriptional regulator [Altererythrobacter sp.]
MANAPVTSYSDGEKIDLLVNETIARVADKWTFLLIEALEDRGAKRFNQLSREVPGISQKMQTQTLRQMEREGLVSRTVFAEVPPRVEYALTDLGHDLGEAFCGVWHWAERNIERIEQARKDFDARG